MQARCPRSNLHHRFWTVAHVTEHWLVDQEGEFIESTTDDTEVLHGPDIDNIWTCAECGAEAIVEDI